MSVRSLKTATGPQCQTWGEEGGGGRGVGRGAGMGRERFKKPRLKTALPRKAGPLPNRRQRSK